MILPEKQTFLAQYSHRSQSAYFKILKTFEDYLTKEGVGDVADLAKLHLTKFGIQVLEPEKMLAISKRKKFNLVKLYLKFLSNNDLIEKDLQVDPPKFTDILNEKMLEMKKRPRAKEKEIEQLLAHAAKVNLRLFIYLSLITHNGMRDSECRSIRLDQIDFSTNIITSGLVAGHAKEGACYYCIPEKLIPHLRKYIGWQNKVYNSPIYLFHSPTSKRGFLSNTSIKKDLKKYASRLKIFSRVNPHTYRHSLNFYRLKMGCDGDLRAILLNQKPKGTNGQYYLDMMDEDPGVRYEFWKRFTWDLIPMVVYQ